MYFEALAKEYHFDLRTPFQDLPPAAQEVILHGTKGKKLKLTYHRADGMGTFQQAFEGILDNVERRFTETQSDAPGRSWRSA